MNDHECCGCDQEHVALPVIDTESGRAYCSDDCLDRASERFWTAVWTA